MDGCTDGWTDRQIVDWLVGWTDGQTAGWIEGGMDGWKDRQTDGWKHYSRFETLTSQIILLDMTIIFTLYLGLDNSLDIRNFIRILSYTLVEHFSIQCQQLKIYFNNICACQLRYNWGTKLGVLLNMYGGNTQRLYYVFVYYPMACILNQNRI